MFEEIPKGPSYYVRLDMGSDHLNLLYVPHEDFGPNQTNQSLMHLFRAYADPCGNISYFDVDEYCIITRRASDFCGLRVYLYDEEAPYEGMYLDGRFVETLGGEI
jgi:hypothetical protein